MHFVQACMLVHKLSETEIRARACISQISEHASLKNCRPPPASVNEAIRLLQDSSFAAPSAIHGAAQSSEALVPFRPVTSPQSPRGGAYTEQHSAGAVVTPHSMRVHQFCRNAPSRSIPQTSSLGLLGAYFGLPTPFPRIVTGYSREGTRPPVDKTSKSVRGRTPIVLTAGLARPLDADHAIAYLQARPSEP